MLDQNVFINNYEETKRRLIRKGVSVQQIEEVNKAIIDRKVFVGEVDGLRAKINEKSKEVGVLYQQGKTDEAKELKASVPSLKNSWRPKRKSLKKLMTGDCSYY